MISQKWRIFFILLVLLAGFLFLTRSFFPRLPPALAKVIPSGKIHLGLDLQGGLYLVLRVETDKAVANMVNGMVNQIEYSMRSHKVRFIRAEESNDRDINILLPGPDQIGQVSQIVGQEFPGLKLVNTQNNAEGTTVHLALDRAEVQKIREKSVAEGLETIRNRIDQFGVRSPDVRTEGTDRILVQLPGIRNFQQAIALIGKTAVLDFKLVAKNASENGGKLPPGTKAYPMRQYGKQGGEQKIVLEDQTLMTGQYISDATVGLGRYGGYLVDLRFDPRGARIFDRITSRNVGRRLAIVLDGVVYSAPVIEEAISGGRAQITGAFTREEAKVLAIALRTGRLPAPVKILEQQTVGPSLGRESIEKGFLASLVGGIGIVLFMILYYRLSGVIADAALAINVLLILAVMAALGATLTLPGIAGIALTIGIAVDANVLIYERIREELRGGKTPRTAVDLGYSRATITILDANVTSLIAALILYQFGTGPVKGFAVTLSIGLVANLFTAIVVTRAIFDYLLSVRHVKSLSI